MRLLRLRVRTLMIAAGFVAVAIWGGVMGTRSYEPHRRSVLFGLYAVKWREIAARKPQSARFSSECSEYFAGQHRKYRAGAWLPWTAMPPDARAPGALAVSP